MSNRTKGIAGLLVVMAVAVTGQAENLVVNNSFEQATNPGIPDGFWNCIYTPDRVERVARRTPADWGIVESGAFHGKHCLQVSPQIWFRTYNFLSLKANQPYTFSIYVKAETPGTKVQFGWFNGTDTFTIGTEWQRIQQTVTPPTDRRIDIAGISQGKGKVWWDALQVEEGKTSTAYSDAGPFDLAEKVLRDGKGTEVPVYEVKRAATPPTLDGNVDDPCWRDCPMVMIASPSGGEKARTEAKIAYDDANLYVAITCFEPEMEKLIAKYTQHDDPVYADDSIELFIDPWNFHPPKTIPRFAIDRVVYNHFMINSLGATAEERKLVMGGNRVDWDPAWQAVVSSQNDRWTLEIAIPLASLVTEGPIPDTWGINLCRSRSHANEYLPWAGAYHRPETFPQVKGIEPDMVLLGTAAASDYRLGADPGVIEVTHALRNIGAKPDKVSPVLMARLGDAKESTACPAVEAKGLAPGAEGIFSFQIPWDGKAGSIHVRVEVKNDQGQVIFSSLAETLDLSLLIGGPGPDYDLYTTEPEMDCRFDVQRLGNQPGQEIEVWIQDLFGKELWRKKIAVSGNELRLAIPLGTLGFGEFRLKARALRDGKAVAARSIAFRRLPPPEAGMVVKANRHRRSVMFDGQPFVGFGTSVMGNFAPTESQAQLDDLKKMGINTLYLWNAAGGFRNQQQPSVVLDNLGTWLDVAQQNGFKVSVQLATFVAAHGVEKEYGNLELLDLLSALVGKYRSHPALLTWELWDEPPNDPALLARVETIHRLIRNLDPYHPVTLNVNQSMVKFKFWKSIADLPSADPYPLPEGHAAQVAIESASMKALAPFQPLRFWLQSYGGSEGKIREPTASELKSMAYMVALHGGSQFLYFTYKPMSPDLYAAWGEIDRELAGLSDALTAASRQTLAAGGAAPGVHASLRCLDQEAVIIAVNLEDDAQTAAFRLPAGCRAGTAEVLFESRQVEVKDGVVRDTFQPLERHVYRLMNERREP